MHVMSRRCEMELLMSLLLGIGLSAACGFRVFVPLLVMSAASLSGHMTLAPGFEWIGTEGAFAVFATASVLEVLSYYVPWVDNLMDSIASPAAVVAGTIVMASSVSDMSPLLKWTLAVVAGGGTAAVFQGATTLVRGASTAMTAGLGNFAVSSAELGISSVLSVLAIALPVVTGAAILLFVLLIGRKLFGRLRRTRQPQASPQGGNYLR
jgi:hypothetical protein